MTVDNHTQEIIMKKLKTEKVILCLSVLYLCLLPIASGDQARTYTKLEMLDAVSEHLHESINSLLFLLPNGKPDKQLQAAHAKDGEAFANKANSYQEMLLEALTLLERDIYTEKFVNKAKADCLAFIRTNKNLLLYEGDEFVSFKDALQKQISINVNEPMLSDSEIAGIRNQYNQDIDFIATHIHDLLAGRNIVLPEFGIPQTVATLVVELSDKNDMDHKLLVKYTKLYIEDMLDKGARKIRNDQKIVTDNLFYGTQGARMIKSGPKRNGDIVVDYITSAVTDSDGNVLLGELQGSLWGLLYNAFNFMYATDEQAEIILEQTTRVKHDRSRLRAKPTVKHILILGENIGKGVRVPGRSQR